MKYVTNHVELGPNGQRAVKALISAGNLYSKAYDKLGIAIVDLRIAGEQEGVTLKQSEIVNLAQCNKGYVSRVFKSCERMAEEESSWDDISTTAVELGISKFMEKYSPTRSQRGKAAIQAEKQLEGEATKAADDLTKGVEATEVTYSFGELMTLVKNVGNRIELSSPKLTAKERSKLQDALLAIYNTLEGEEVPADQVEERRRAPQPAQAAH